MDNQTTVSIKFQNSVTGQSKLEKYAETLKQINSVIGAIDTGKQKEVEKNAKNLKDESGDINKNINTAFSIVKFRAISRTISDMATKITKLTKKSAEYLENMNLLDVAFNDNTTEAEKFVNTLTEMYGLDESWGYRTVGIFKQLSNAMGLSNETGVQLSKTLTQLSIDLASLYNVEVEDAVSKLQSALAGQTKPVRFFGADITQSTLQLTLETHGIDRAISDLSYAEKRLLIVASILEQTKEAQGDWGRTITSTANQMRIFSQQVERLTRSLGNMFLPVLKRILPYINGIMMVLVEITSFIGQLIAKLFNYEEEDYFSGTDDSVNDLIGDLGTATDKSEKLKSSLRGFDKLNNITSNADVASAGLGISPEILDLFNKYSSGYLDNLDKISSKATEIRDKIMEWLGFEKLVDEETGDISFKFKEITGGTILGGLFLANLGAGLFKTISKVLKKAGFGFSKTGGLSLMTKLTIFITGLVLTADAIDGLLDEGATWENVLKSLGSGAMIAGGTFMLTKNATVTLAVTALVLGVEAILAVKNLWDELMDSIDYYANNDGKTTFTEIIQSWCDGMTEIILPIIGDFLIKITPFGTMFDELNKALPENKTFWQSWGDGMKLILKSVSDAWQNVINKINTALKKYKEYFSLNTNDGTYSVGDLFYDMTHKDGKSGISAVIDRWLSGMGFKADGGLYKNGKWHDINQYANGGLPPVGQMFVAREKGPELVGTIGSSTAVMNNNQIVSSVSAGVYQAVRSAMGSGGTQVFNIYLDEDHKLGTYTLEQLQDMAKSNGEPITIG